MWSDCMFALALFLTAVAAVDQVAYLKRYGYLQPDEGTVVSAEDLRKATQMFQKFFRLPETGIMDAATEEWMKKKRCGNVDMPPKEGGNRSTVQGRFDATNGKWPRDDLKWAFPSGGFGQISKPFTFAEATLAFSDAFSRWSAVSALTFEQVETASAADIGIFFASGAHPAPAGGIGEAFDGQGNVLAHAFGPEVGDAHYDDDEEWILSDTIPNDKIDLVAVAIHEFGHSIGLGHSDVAGSIMLPIYTQGVDNPVLGPDDIAGVQSLYPIVDTTEGPTPPMESTTEGPTLPMESTTEGPTPPMESTTEGPTPPMESTTEGPTPPMESTTEGPTPPTESTVGIATTTTMSDTTTVTATTQRPCRFGRRFLSRILRFLARFAPWADPCNIANLEGCFSNCP